MASQPRTTRVSSLRVGALSLVAVLASAWLPSAAKLEAQHVSEYTHRDKTEIFIQHLVKILRLDPGRYQTMVLEYEIGTALAEHSPEIAQDLAGLDFIRNSLAELYPGFARADSALGAGKFSELEVALGLLEKRGDGKVGSADPWANVYFRAYAGLLGAELDYHRKDYAGVIERCEELNRKYREHLIADTRVCELIALSYGELERPLMEFAQWALLATDYEEISPELKARAQERMAALNQEVGRPLHTVAGWMNKVEKLLSDELTGDEPTQKEERNILVALDKLIELQEAQERKSCKSCGSGNCEGCKNGKPKGNKSKTPAKVSALPPEGEGITKLRGVSRGDSATIWGLLEEKDAARALKSFGGKLPPRYEKLLKEYYKALAEEE